MLSQRRIACSRGAIVGGIVGMLFACQALAAPLLDFKDNAQLALIRVAGQTKIELASESNGTAGHFCC